MTKTGVYALWWNSHSLAYIGSSTNIFLSYAAHLHACKTNTHTDFKVYHAYKQYGEPELIVLELCKESELALATEVWRQEFISITEQDISSVQEVTASEEMFTVVTPNGAVLDVFDIEKFAVSMSKPESVNLLKKGLVKIKTKLLQSYRNWYHYFD